MTKRTRKCVSSKRDVVNQGFVCFLYGKRLELPAKELQMARACFFLSGKKALPLAPLNVQSDDRLRPVPETL